MNESLTLIVGEMRRLCCGGAPWPARSAQYRELMDALAEWERDGHPEQAELGPRILAVVKEQLERSLIQAQAPARAVLRLPKREAGQ